MGYVPEKLEEIKEIFRRNEAVMKILNFGFLNIDYVYKVPHIITRGETMRSLGREIYVGGKGLNQSVAMARAGLKVWHAGAVGPDGEMLVAFSKIGCRQKN